LPAACAEIWVGGGDILGAEHYGDIVGYGAPHGQAIDTVAVTYPGDKRRSECPHSVTQTFFFVALKGFDSLFFCECFHTLVVRSAEEVIVEFANDLSELTSVGGQGDSVAVSFFLVEDRVSAEAGDADDGVYETEDLFDILDGNNLAEVVFLHFSCDESSDDGFYEGGSFGEDLKFFDGALDLVGVREEFFDKFLSVNIA